MQRIHTRPASLAAHVVRTLWDIRNDFGGRHLSRLIARAKLRLSIKREHQRDIVRTSAYERCFEETTYRAVLAIAPMLGLFNRPATGDCLAALRSSRDWPMPTARSTKTSGTNP